MEVSDDFIAGIHNYCDRWCETCAFTSRCRVFADCAAMEATHDPNFKAIAEAPPLPQDVPAPPPRWFQEFIAEWNEAARDMTDDEARQLAAERASPEHAIIQERARAYSYRTAGWLQTVERPGERDHADPRSILAHDCVLIPAKVYRALSGLRRSPDEPEDGPPDYDGSAKVALLSIDRSRAAWIMTVEVGLAPAPDVEPMVSELGLLSDELERLFPRARAFIRPGFDEPAAVR